MSIRTIVGGGVRLIQTQPRLVSIWAALYLAAMTVGMIVMRPWTAAMLTFQQQAAANAATNIKTPPGLPAEWFGMLFVFEIIVLVLMVIAFAAVVRAITRPSGDRLAYLRLGMDELRLIGLGIVLAVAVLVAEMIAILALVLVGIVIGLVAGNAAAGVIAIVLAIGLPLVAIYLGIHLSLAGALTVMRGRIVIRDAWRATQGHFWALLGVFALLAVMFGLVIIIGLALTNPHLLAAYAGLDPQAMTAAAQDQIARQSAGLSVGMFVQLLIGAIAGTLMGVVGFGAIATAAIELSDANATGRAVPRG